MKKLRRILILDERYPSQGDLYSNVFVHVRAKAYSEHAEVVIGSFPNTKPDWVHEGIRVRTFASTDRLRDFIAEYRPDVIAGHFVEGPIITDVLIPGAIPFVAWVHGYEALGWYRRLFRIESAARLAGFAVSGTRRLLKFRRLVAHCRRTGRGAFVVPSRWMLNTVQLDTLARLPRAEIVPNPIDGALFRYVEKTPDMRTRVLLLRSFDSRKYATDIAVDAIVHLSSHPAFASFQFSLYGRGRLFAPAAARLRPFANVRMHERYVAQADIPALHAEHGVMLCPTRQDSQGVTMCEAMSSGLVPLATRNAAIPEFVTDGVGGLLSASSREIAAQLLQLRDDPDLFARLSRGAAAEVRRKCELTQVVERELEILERAVARTEPAST